MILFFCYYPDMIIQLFYRLYFGGFMAIAHGFPKLINYSAMSQQFPDPLGVGSAISLALVIFAELVCSLLVVVGFFTRLACIPLIITMFIAVFVIHGSDPFSVKELALLYLLGFTGIFIFGPGSLSLSKKLPIQYWLTR